MAKKESIDDVFAKLTAEDSRYLAAHMDGGMGMGKRPPQRKENAKKKNATSRKRNTSKNS